MKDNYEQAVCKLALVVRLSGRTEEYRRNIWGQYVSRRGSIPESPELCLHSPNTSSWRGAYLSTDNFTFTLR
jgi:hypothetical protein